jgi:quercetin dioxygenase-like cupin family protein
MNAFKTIAVSIMLATGSFTSSATWADSHAKRPSFISVKASELKWTDAPSVGPGAKISVIEGDLKAAEPFIFRLKVPVNSKLGVHTHPTFERVTVISGSLYFAIGDKYEPAKAEEYTPGDAFIVPPGMPMFGYTKMETVVQIHGTGPWGIHFHNPADDPRKK